MAHWFLSVTTHHWKHAPLVPLARDNANKVDSFCCPLRRGLYVFHVTVHRTTRVGRVVQESRSSGLSEERPEQAGVRS